MHTHLIDSLLEGFNYKLYLLAAQLFNDLLDNMITVSIFDTLIYLKFYFVHQLILLNSLNDLKSLLNYSATVLVHRKI